MAGIKQLRAWFFTPTSTKDRLRNKDIPTQQTFENLAESAAFKTETDDKAKISTGASLSTEQGLVVLASDVQAKANASQLSDRSLVVQPSQLPTAEAIVNSTVEDMPTTPLAITTGAASTRNQYTFRLAPTWVTWLISRLFKAGGTTGQVPIKTNGTDYNWTWGQLGNDTTFINALTTNSTFTTQLQTTINNIITSNPTFITEGLPVGFIQIYPTTTMPSAKWLRCDGSAISRTTYSDLFALIGTTYGVGNGSTTFNIPDFRDKQATGYSGSKGIGTTGGADSHTISSANLPPHTHGAGTLTASGNHNHSLTFELATIVYQGGATNLSNIMTTNGTGDSKNTGGANAGASTGATSDGGFANDALDTKDQYLAINMIIKVTL